MKTDGRACKWRDRRSSNVLMPAQQAPQGIRYLLAVYRRDGLSKYFMPVRDDIRIFIKVT